MAKMKRSKGITFLGWLFLLNSLLGIITLFNLKKRIMSFEVAHFDLPESYYYAVLLFAIIAILAGFIAGIGLLRTYPWARYFVLYWTFFCCFWVIISFFVYSYRYTIPYFIEHGKPTVIIYGKIVASLGWAAFICYYFNRPSIKAQFENKEMI